MSCKQSSNDQVVTARGTGGKIRYALLDPLRGLAALWVFAFHFPWTASQRQAWPTVHAFSRLGHLGVPLFFVISGYCLMASLRAALRREESVGSFLYRRLRRVYPPLWCSLVVVAAVPFIIELVSFAKTGQYTAPSSEPPYMKYLEYNVADWLSVATLTRVFWVTERPWDLQGKFTGINAVYWTLAIEVQFYAIIAAALLVRRWAIGLLGLVTGVWAVSIVTSSSLPAGWFLPFWPTFAGGILVYLLRERGWGVEQCCGRWAPGIAVVATAALGCAIATWASQQAVPHHATFGLATTLWLWAGSAFDPLFLRASQHRWSLIRWLAGLANQFGLMSYSIYLLHGRLQFLPAQFVRQVVSVDSLMAAVATVLGTCGLCYLFYRVCEHPFAQPVVSRPPTPVAAAGAVSIKTAAVAAGCREKCV